MKRVFLFGKTDVVVVPDRGGSTKFVGAVENALGRTVIIETSATIGAGVILGDRVVTSLFLVANVQEVFVRFARGKKMSAFVAKRDAYHNLAEIVPSSRALSAHCATLLTSFPEPKLGNVDEFGTPLLVVNVGTGVPKAQVASVRYVTNLASRFEDKLRINGSAPRGFIGGGVWNIDGNLIGLAIGEKVYPPGDHSLEKSLPGVYALPGEQVMEFAES